ncbi:hypothetical protein V9T40_004712 [Parthenolecanium corni]|uniref:Uncharacterized protein n=1 Tax=Parthenolecanium corni TaxID=536013 RepID=A0AAN9TEK6_9HEMI
MKEKSVFTSFLLLIIFCHFQTRATDDKFIKRYAIMKMYESCFGPEVVKEIRKEMKMAAAKCSSNGLSNSHQLNSPVANKNPITFVIQPHKPPQQAEGLYSPELLKSQTSSSSDFDKLQQFILAGFNKQNQPQTIYSANNVVPSLGYSHIKPWTFGPPSIATSHSHMNGLTPGPFPSPYFNQFNPLYPLAFLSPFYGSGRSSKDLDLKGHLESVAAKISGRFKNITCIMQDLGYLNENLEPDYESIVNKIKSLTISTELKSDMIDAVQYCKQFSMCVPDERKDQLSKEMMRPMFFFRCYKHKKMEACIMKDIKDRYTSNEVDDNILGYRRNDRSNHDFNISDIAELTSYEFLFGEDYTDYEIF